MAITAEKLAHFREHRDRNRASLKAASRKYYQTYGSTRRNPEIKKAMARRYYYKVTGNLEAVQKEQEKIDQLRLINPRKKSGAPIQFGDEERILRRKAVLRKARYKHVVGIDSFNEPGTCEICGRSEVKMCLDHCHEQNVFRGWICDDCNIAMGRVNDNVETLKAMIRYIQKGARRVKETAVS